MNDKNIIKNQVTFLKAAIKQKANNFKETLFLIEELSEKENLLKIG